MRGFYNEKGNTLLIVLLIIIVFSIVGISLLSMNISAAKQFNKKEEQVQARHLAEMGVLHYKTSVEEAVDSHSKSFVYVYTTIKNNGNGSNIVKVIDEVASKRKYYNELCLAVSNININSTTKQLGSYTVTGSSGCSVNTTGETPSHIIINVDSTGQVMDVTKKIVAEVRVSSEGSTTGGDEGEISQEVKPTGKVPEKPKYPLNNWQNISPLSTLDNIKDPLPAKIVHAITSKSTFETTSFVEIIGAADMAKKSNWTFKDHLIIAGSFKTNTGGKDNSSIVVNKDFYIGGAFDHLSNHTKSIVGGDFIVMGDMVLGTKSQLTVIGNALFGYGISNVDTHAKITVNQDAFFKKYLGNVKNKASVCVKGDIYLWKTNQWAPYLSSDSGYEGFDKSCLKKQPINSGEKFNWSVHPFVNAEYK